MSQLKRICAGLMMVGALALVSSPAFAKDDAEKVEKADKKEGRGVPEIEPYAIGAVAAVLVGGTLLIGARRRKRA
jgi:hypothetical protein